MEQINNCPNCSNRLYHNKGISKKNNKHYENYKCGSCDYIKWVDLREQSQDARPNTGNQILLDGIENIIKSQRDIWRLLDMINNKLNK